MLKHGLLDPPLPSKIGCRPAVGSEICISNKFPGGADLLLLFWGWRVWVKAGK